MKGRIHSIESFGTVDGPGIRCVVFFQGCSLRCRYCHNPDTWNRDGGIEADSREVVEKLKRFKTYFGEEGGITLSGGEPLLQPEFAASILQECKEKGIHTAIDTSGWVEHSALEKVLPFTDLLLLDIKALDSTQYKWLTGQTDEKFHLALQKIKEHKKKLWLRYVVLPGINDSEQQLGRLKEWIDYLSPNVQKVELLPYHRLGVHKWKELGLNYSLSELEPPNMDHIECLAEKLEI